MWEQAEQEELQKQGDKGKVGVDEYYQEAELTVTEVQTKLTPLMLFTDASGIGILLVLSTSEAGILIFRKKEG